MYEKFRQIIEKKGMTAYRVAKDCGIPAMTLYDWKAGRTKPKTDKLSKIAKYLGVTIEDLIELDGEEKRVE